MRNIEDEVRGLNLKNPEVEKFDKRFKAMFKFFAAFFVFALVATLTIWGVTAYLLVSKGPETVQRVERVVDAYADKLETENKNNKKSE